MSLHVADRPLFEAPEARAGLGGDFRAAMRRLGATVAVITGADQGRSGGLTATAVCPVCIDPPSLLICVNRSSNTHGLIAGSRRFAVNFLDQGQRDVAETFAGRGGHDGEAKFDGAGTWLDGGADLPMLHGAVAFVACRVVRDMAVDTHTVFVGVVERVASTTDGRPLLYADRQFAALSE